MRSPRIALGAGMVVLSVLITGAIAAAVTGQQTAPEKLAFKVREQTLRAAERAKSEANPAPQQDGGRPIAAPPRSDIPLTVIPYPKGRLAGPFKDDRWITTVANVLAPDGRTFTVYAGSAVDDAGRGTFVIFDRSRPDGSTSRSVALPGRSGAVTLTAISGEELEFSTANGVAGRLNVRTGVVR